MKKESPINQKTNIAITHSLTSQNFVWVLSQNNTFDKKYTTKSVQ